MLLYMLKNDSALQNSIDYYRQNYFDCSVEVPPMDTGEKSQDQGTAQRMQQHLQTFLFEATTYYLVLGFVVFRFCKLPLHPSMLVPVIIPIGDIEWSYGQGGNASDILQIPEIDVPRHFSAEHTRYYVYKFRSTGQYFSTESSGILCRLAHSYRRLVHARDYDLIIRNENLRKTIYIEQNLKQDTSVLNQGNRSSEYGELQAIMDYTRGFKATTHSITPPTQNEELKMAISVSHPSFPYFLRGVLVFSTTDSRQPRARNGYTLVVCGWTEFGKLLCEHPNDASISKAGVPSLTGAFFRNNITKKLRPQRPSLSYYPPIRKPNT